ncbi:butyrophilin subfamily 3 member A1-like [Osmerus mordax]|uniref:butyrophilin subfamily 3 member A1-like n=1 Tax=Osmerus mordax TaxID=8014 RepID=UPI00350FC5C3
MKYVLLFKLLSLLTRPTNQQDKFEVLGGSVIVLAGENATLPCHLKPSISAVNLKVDWTKVLSSDNISKVHVYENQKDVEAEADSTYRGRTSLFREELQKGNVSLKLIQAKLSDRGQYRCGVQTADWYEEAEVQVSVKGEGSLPMVDIGKHSGWGLEVLCQSTGWHPQPELVWLDSEGQVLPAEHIETSRGQDGLYDIKGIVVVQRNTNQITCRIQQQLIGHMLQTKIDISNDLFPKLINFIMGLVIIVALLIFVVILILCCLYKKRRDTLKAQSWARSRQNTTCIAFQKRQGSEDEKAVLKHGKDVNLSFMQFAKSHIIQNENLKKQLDVLNTRLTLDYSKVVTSHRTINLDADNAHVDLEVNDKDVQNTGKKKLSFEPKNLERGTEHDLVEGSQKTVEPASNTHKRFKKAPCVLAKDEFSSGEHYFIVEVPENGWIVGVAKASINKEKTLVCSVQEGCWTLRSGQGKLRVHDGTMIALFMTKKTEKVGVFVNCDESFVSFYNVTQHDDTNKSADHIYTYTNCTFESGNGQKKVYPLFGIGSLETLNSKLIIVDPVTND